MRCWRKFLKFFHETCVSTVKFFISTRKFWELSSCFWKILQLFSILRVEKTFFWRSRPPFSRTLLKLLHTFAVSAHLFAFHAPETPLSRGFFTLRRGPKRYFLKKLRFRPSPKTHFFRDPPPRGQKPPVFGGVHFTNFDEIFDPFPDPLGTPKCCNFGCLNIATFSPDLVSQTGLRRPLFLAFLLGVSGHTQISETGENPPLTGPYTAKGGFWPQKPPQNSHFPAGFSQNTLNIWPTPKTPFSGVFGGFRPFSGFPGGFSGTFRVFHQIFR